MKKTRKRHTVSRVLSSLAVLWLAATACATPGGGAAPATATDGKIKLTLAEGSSGYSFVWSLTVIAEEEGFFDQAGLEVERVLVPGTPIQALASGSVSAVNSAPSHLVNAQAEGTPIVGVFPLLQTSTPSIIVSKSRLADAALPENPSLAQRAEVLRGARIGLNSLTGGDGVLTRALLRQAGMDPERDVELVPLNSTQNIEAAWQRGEIDAFASSPPSAEQAILSGKGDYLLRGGHDTVPGFQHYPHQIMMVTADFAEQNPEAVTRLVEAYLLAADALQNRADEMADVVHSAAFPNLDDELFDLSWESILPATTTPDNADLTEDMFKDVLASSNEARAASGLDPVEDITSDDIFTNEFLEAARKRT